ncbi:MAG: J domain-containing protein, partial [bacterium]
EIKSAYRALAKKYHPDKYMGNPLYSLTVEKMQLINSAYETLIDPEKRRIYDEGFSEGSHETSKADVEFKIGISYLFENRLKEAEDSFRRAILVDPTKPIYYVHLIQAISGQNNFELAHSLILEFENRFPNNIEDIASLKVNFIIFSGKYSFKEALEIIDNSINKAPDSLLLKLLKAQLYLIMEKNIEGIRYIKNQLRFPLPDEYAIEFRRILVVLKANASLFEEALIENFKLINDVLSNRLICEDHNIELFYKELPEILTSRFEYCNAVDEIHEMERKPNKGLGIAIVVSILACFSVVGIIPVILFWVVYGINKSRSTKVKKFKRDSLNLGISTNPWDKYPASTLYCKCCFYRKSNRCSVINRRIESFSKDNWNTAG